MILRVMWMQTFQMVEFKSYIQISFKFGRKTENRNEKGKEENGGSLLAAGPAQRQPAFLPTPHARGLAA